MENSGMLTQIMVMMIACVSGLNGGFQVGWISPSLVKLQADDSDLPITSAEGAWVASAFSFASPFGCLMSGAVINKWGRRLTLIPTAIPYLICYIIIILAQNYWWLIIARCIAALGHGAIIAIIQLYLSEIASSRIRGALGVLANQIVDLGILLAYCIGPWSSRVVFAGVGFSLSIVHLFASFWIPESPYFLVMKNRNEEAERILTRLRGTADVTDEMKSIEENISMGGSGHLKDILIIVQENRKALVVLVILTLTPQLSGITAILAYNSLILEESGFVLSSSVSVIIIGVVQLLSAGLSLFTADSLGKRPLLLLSLSGSMIFLVAEALYFQLQAIGTDVTSISWLPVTAICGYVIFYSIALGCLPYVIIAELFPCNVKAMAMICAIFVSAFSGMAVAKLYQVISDAYGIHASFWTFAACSLVMLFFIYFLVPETKQRTLTEIQKELRSMKDSTTSIK